MSYARQRPRPGPRRGVRSQEIKAAQPVRQRAEAGEPCYFWGRPGFEDCPGGWNWALPYNHRWAYTAHHLVRVMDGGQVIAHPDAMAPAHRRCNARDGLMAQNARRQGFHLAADVPERNSQPW